MNIIGIDPGVTGAICHMGQDGQIISIHDTPKVAREMNLAEASNLMVDMRGPGSLQLVAIENVWIMPGTSAKAATNFMTYYGAWQGIAATLGNGIEKVTPQTWMKMGFLPKRKPVKRKEEETVKDYNAKRRKAKTEHLKAMEATAIARWPYIENWNSGKVAAAFIAEYVRQRNNGSQL